MARIDLHINLKKSLLLFSCLFVGTCTPTTCKSYQEVMEGTRRGETPNFLGWRFSSYLLGVKIQGFGTAKGARDNILTIAYSAVPFRA